MLLLSPDGDFLNWSIHHIILGILLGHGEIFLLNVFKKNTPRNKKHTKLHANDAATSVAILTPLKQKKTEASSSWLQTEGIQKGLLRPSAQGFQPSLVNMELLLPKKKEGLGWHRMSLYASHGKCSFASLRHNWAWCPSTSFLSTECTYVLLNDDLSLSPESLQSILLWGLGGSQTQTNIWLYHFTVEIIERLLG